MRFWKLSHGWLSYSLIWYYTCVHWLFPLWFHFLVFSPLLGSHETALLVYLIWFSQIFILAKFHFSWCNCWTFAWLEFLISFFSGALVAVPPGMPTKKETSEVLHWWMAFVGMHIWVLLWFTCWSFLSIPPYWHPHRYCWEGLLLWIFPLRVSIPTCVNFPVLIVVFLLNIVQNTLLHLWRTSVVCWIVLGKTLLCLIFYPFFWGGCMTYGIWSVPLLFICTSQLIHVFLWCSIFWSIVNYYSCPLWV